MKTLQRVAFKTSRLLEFCSERELTAQTGHGKADWPLVIEKELVDNALDGCEEAETAPKIDIEVDASTGAIVVADNGPGIPAQTVRDILDYTARVSSREAYVSPTRGAQGNALKTLLAMPFVLDGKTGTTVIETRSKRHTITFRVDQLRQQPAIDHEVTPLPSCKNGTRISIGWPHSACSVLESAETRFLQIADDFSWLNRHLEIAVRWNGILRVCREPSNAGWQKWRACDPTSAHWYDADRLERYIAAHVSRDVERRRDRTVREFIAELKGFSGSAKQKAVLEATGLARASLSSLFNAAGEPDKATIAALLAALKTHSKLVRPADLGIIGKEHLLARFQEIGLESETFKYQKVVDYADDGLPWVVETAFGWCPELGERRRIIGGVNWSVGLGNPFRSLKGGEGLETILAQQRAGYDKPIAFVLHYACPRAAYTDRGKSAVIFPGSSAAPSLRRLHAMEA